MFWNVRPLWYFFKKIGFDSEGILINVIPYFMEKKKSKSVEIALGMQKLKCFGSTCMLAYLLSLRKHVYSNKLKFYHQKKFSDKKFR